MKLLTIFTLLLLPLLAQADYEVKLVSNIPYKTGDEITDYEKERCQLDLYIPEGVKDYPTLIWFHGGGLQNGDKADYLELYENFVSKGIAVVAVNHRLSPKSYFPEYIIDSAEASAWAYNHIANFDGDPARIFISGHSAGGYLALMLGLDSHYLDDAGFPFDKVAGLAPISGQTVVHNTIIGERKLPAGTVRVDVAAPLYHVNKDVPPFLILAGSDDLPSRALENQLLASKLLQAGHEDTALFVVPNRDHGTITSEMANSNDPGAAAIIEFIAAH